VDVVSNGADALARVRAERYSVVLLDVFFDGDWRQVMAEAQNNEGRPRVILMSGHAGVSVAVEAMRAGAADFLEKPASIDSLLRTAEGRVATPRRSVRGFEVAPPSGAVAAASTEAPWLSPAMGELFRTLDRISQTPTAPVFLVGESGVGKERLAERVHEASARRHGPFVRVNVAAIPASVVEAEMFGSVQGAYTGSQRDRAGYFALANGGTILLDEIGELRIDLQAKLLRVLESRSFFPVGGDVERNVDVRVVAATNRDPEHLIRLGALRSDLYYRLGLAVHVPPLRERVSEILPLAREFVRRFCSELQVPYRPLSSDAEARLLEHRWPGNVRELRNVIERAVLLSDGPTLEPTHLELRPPKLPPVERQTGTVPLGADVNSTRLADARALAVESVERARIVQALSETRGNRLAAAKLLGMARSTFYQRLRRYRLTR
jgi:DNA-binding NtrC family response regulator